jgi:hypothetical protein
MFVFVSCFPLALINVWKQVNIDLLVSTLRRRRGIFFLKLKISFQNSNLYAHAVYVEKRLRELFCQRQIGVFQSCHLRLDLVLSKIPYK